MSSGNIWEHLLWAKCPAGSRSWQQDNSSPCFRARAFAQDPVRGQGNQSEAFPHLLPLPEIQRNSWAASVPGPLTLPGPPRLLTARCPQGRVSAWPTPSHLKHQRKYLRGPSFSPPPHSPSMTPCSLLSLHLPQMQLFYGLICLPAPSSKRRCPCHSPLRL